MRKALSTIALVLMGLVPLKSQVTETANDVFISMIDAAVKELNSVKASSVATTSGIIYFVSTSYYHCKR